MSIEQIPLGRIGLGTGPLAGLYRPVTGQDASATLAAAWEAGIRFFDTAPHYGAGLAERRIGEFLAGRPRQEVVVSTKVGRLLVPGRAEPGEEHFWGAPQGLVRQRDYSRDGVRRSIADSLDRCGLDRFDIVLIHDPDDYWEDAIRFAYPALAQLRAEGAVSAIGVGMNQWQMLLRFVQEADLDLVLLAGRYTLLDRTAAAELLPACQQRRVSVVAGGVFNSGVLANPDPGAHFDYRPVPEPVLRHALELRRRCERYGVPLAAAAIQFPLRHPAVAAVLVGARTAAEITTDVALAAQPVPPPLWEELDQLRLPS